MGNRMYRVARILAWIVMAGLIVATAIAGFVNRNIDSVIMNRVGIGLNFAATFLITPELLGMHRVTKFQLWLLSSIKRFLNWYYRPTRFTVRNVIFDLLNIVLVVVGIRYTMLSGLYINLVAGFLLPFVLLLGLHSLVYRLADTGRFHSTLLTWGVIFFVVGNAIQFIATF